ncbi:E3 ubiquitin-protein ligase TRIM33-like [Haliotis asinina]|uniref:E3 ubiquitin-protein ligase TRIM33-like n=1 Tax=Haliotis asinina TaxID=109174 RepID=UPI003531F6E8
MSEPQDKVDVGSLKDTFLECPVCVEHFNQTDRRPRLLHTCLHAFCTQCLQQLLAKEGKGQITCPLCRNVQRVTGTVNTLEVDSLRDKLVEFLQIKQDNKVLCSECPEMTTAVSRCQECQSYLCEECDFVHRRHRVSRDHSILSLEDVLKQPTQRFGKGHFCPRHPKHHTEFYCMTEEKLCCVSCTILDHKDHELQTLEEAAATRKAELVTKIKQIHAHTDHLREEMKAGSQTLTRIEEAKARSISDISKVFDYLKKILDIRRRKLMEDVSENSRILSSGINKMMESHEQTLAIIESTDTYFAQAMQTADAVEMLQIYPSIKRTIESLSVPLSTSTSRGNNDASDLQFKLTNLEGVVSLIRKVGTFTKLPQTPAVPTKETVEVSAVKVCVICCSAMSDPQKLKCGHQFCKQCVAKCSKPVCPVCKVKCYVIRGNMPLGSMTDRFESFSDLPGFKGCGTIVITYVFNGGYQTIEHPEPGKWYKGITRTAYLPGNAEGQKVLALLRVAWERRLTFTIGRSVTMGRDGCIIWTKIHHKKNRDGGPINHGYPDPDYLRRVQKELADQGVTEEDLGATGSFVL